MSEPIPFFGWLQDIEENELMLRKQIDILQEEFNKLKEENYNLRKRIEALMEGREFK